MNYDNLLNAAYAFEKTAQELNQNEKTNLRPLSGLLANLRAASHVHQTHHWQTHGQEYYADHLLFMRLYDESQATIDQVAERSVGGESAELVDALEQINAMASTVKTAYANTPNNTPEDMISRSLKVEMMILENIKNVIDTLTSTDSLSPGTSNLLEGAADVHETFVYLLKQRSA